MTKVDPEVRIPDPIELDRLEEERLRAAAGLAPLHAEGGEYAGFDTVERKRWTRHGSTKHLFHDYEVADKIDYTLNRQGEPMSRFDGHTAPSKEPRTK